ncbi:iron-containing redox enzyme family protein [Granulicoccus sp. GXG6511]|uniref:iron-containing redox enzyme family protein n=1 Tax=Granulicoccus sp. GXG6511 TaxID=3381351 RepID=UPI003D7E2725
MLLPSPRGPLSAAIREVLLESPGDGRDGVVAAAELLRQDGSQRDLLHDEDFQITLFLLHALHYRRIAGVDDRWEWDPDLLRVRQVLEDRFETSLRELVDEEAPPIRTAEDVAQVLFERARNAPGPSVSRFVARRATQEQVLEWLVQKSPYQLMEADPHTWAIPRLTGPAKAALVEIQSDEYGGGIPGRMHAEMFRTTMATAGLRTNYGAYLDHIPAITLAGVNAMTLFGLNRRLRGAVAGHLAMFEMTSSQPNRNYARGLRRLNWPEPAAAYFDEHVEADAVHEQIAGRELAGRLVEDHPDEWPNVLFGADCALQLDRLAGEHYLESWTGGRTSLRKPLPSSARDEVVA